MAWMPHLLCRLACLETASSPSTLRPFDPVRTASRLGRADSEEDQSSSLLVGVRVAVIWESLQDTSTPRAA